MLVLNPFSKLKYCSSDRLFNHFVDWTFLKHLRILIIVIFVIFNRGLSSTLSSSSGDASTILVKTKRPSRDIDFNFLTPSCSHFSDFLVNSNYVVDTSLLIKEIVSLSEDILLISAPPAFGKSTNLGMIQLFFEYQLKDDVLVRKDRTSGYRYFKYGRYVAKDGSHVFSDSPLISRYEDFLEMYQGNHPVIYFDFKPPNGASYPYKIEPIKRIICEKISLEFKRHFYVQKYFAKLIGNQSIAGEVKRRAREEWKQFEVFALNRQLDWIDMADSLRFLSRVLFKFFGNKVVILIDEMDFLVNHVKENWIYRDEPRPKDQDKCVTDFLGNFVNSTFNGNDHLMKVVIAGRTMSCIDELFVSVGRPIRILDGMSNSLAEFYGFTESVSERFLKIGNVSRQVTVEAMNWYAGYRFDVESNHTILCPWDIIQVVVKKSVRDYWVKANFDDKMGQLMVLEFMESVMRALVRGECIPVPWINVRFCSRDFMRIFDLVNERVARPTADDVGLVLKRLYAAGYVTLAGVWHNETGLDEHCYLKVPNRQVANQIRNTIEKR